MDRGYDNNRVYGDCHERGVSPVIPLRKGRIQPETPIKRGMGEWATLYRRRTAVEREFGRLKHAFGHPNRSCHWTRRRDPRAHAI
jgi:hypothetical protein